MTLLLPREVTEPYPPAVRVVRRPFLLNTSLTSISPTQKFNEKNKIEHLLAERPIADDEVFLGIAGFKGFDLLALAGKQTGKQYTKAVLFDMNERQLQAMEAVLKLIAENDTPEKFIQAFKPVFQQVMEPRDLPFSVRPELTPAEKEQFFVAFGGGYQPQNAEQMENFLNIKKKSVREESWLSSGNYAYIRQLVQKGDIALAHLDLCDKERVETLVDWLKAQNLRVGEFYISSILDFVDPFMQMDYYSIYESSLQKSHDFYDNLSLLTHDATQFIVSHSSEVTPIFHSYDLQVLNKDQVMQRETKLPANDPDWRDKSSSVLFEAGGQVWRLASFEMPPEIAAQNTNAQGGRYYRIFQRHFQKCPVIVRNSWIQYRVS